MAHLRYLALAVVVGLLAIAPAGAAAAPFPPRLTFAYDLALEYWGEEPAACASVDKQIVPPGSLGNADVGAISGQSSHVPAGALPGSIDCILWIDRAYAEPIIFDLLCAVVFHGVGHLLGREYSLDPRNVMHESIPIPPLCKTKGEQSARLYLLRLKFHWLQTRQGPKVERLRERVRGAMDQEAKRFWSMP